MRRKIFCKIKDKGYFTFLCCSKLKNLPMKKEKLCGAAEVVRFDFGFV